jgi:hypothetical protein
LKSEKENNFTGSEPYLVGFSQRVLAWDGCPVDFFVIGHMSHWLVFFGRMHIMKLGRELFQVFDLRIARDLGLMRKKVPGVSSSSKLDSSPSGLLDWCMIKFNK